MSLVVKWFAPYCFEICDRITLAARQLYSVCFGLFQLFISLTILCYIGNCGKSLHFRMLKIRGSSDLISIINVHKKYWSGKVYRNISVVRYWGGFWFFAKQNRPWTRLHFSDVFDVIVLDQGKGWKQSPGREDSPLGLQRERGRWVPGTPAKAWNRSKFLLMSCHVWEAFQLRNFYILKWETCWYYSVFFRV